MNFFERQRHVRRMSVRLVLLFAVAVVGIIATVDVAVLFAFNLLGQRPSQLVGILVTSTIATAAVIGLATLYRMATLRGGGGRVARELGGDYVPHDTTDPQLRRLRNVVEEIAIASGVPVPEVYVLQDEAGINAFAAGWSTSDAAVAVTRGALERLNRDELQGVIAHEFSHVVNGDMRLNIRLMGLLFGILFLAVMGETLLRAGVFSRSSRDEKGGNPLPLIGIALLVAGYIGVVVGRIIKASVSRQREYLADASAVQFTRQTTGLAGALKKIAGVPGGSKLINPKAEEVSHMLFGSSNRLSSLFATHPPLVDRIKALDPSFDPAQLQQLAEHWAQSPPVGMQEDVALGLAPGLTAPPPLGDVTATTEVAAGNVIAQVASPTDAAHRHAEALLEQIPESLRAKARSVDHVVPLVLGLLLSADPQVREVQYAELTAKYGRETADAALAEADGLVDLHPLLHLPLAELAFPTLRHRSQREQAALLGAVFALIHADGRISTFEYCLSRMLHSELYESLHPKPRWRSEYRSLRASLPEVTALLAVLAQAGQDDPEAARRAFQAGAALVLPPDRQEYRPPARGVLELEPVWPVLDDLNPTGKERLLRAAVTVISHDGVMTVTEIELLRTICALLHCPLPPLTSS